MTHKIFDFVKKNETDIIWLKLNDHPNDFKFFMSTIYFIRGRLGGCFARFEYNFFFIFDKIPSDRFNKSECAVDLAEINEYDFRYANDWWREIIMSADEKNNEYHLFECKLIKMI